MRSLQKLLLICIIIIGSYDQVFSQQSFAFSPVHEGIIPPSPDAANLAKFSDIKTNYFTGSPNISIPIHTIQGKNISYGINLRYDATGRKVAEVASPVGLGWTLETEGIITRTVRGLPDEVVADGYFHAYRDWIDEEYIDWFENQIPPDESAESLEAYDFVSDVYHGEIDLLPDVYNFNFNGYSGVIMFKVDTPCFTPEPIIYPQQNLKIERDFNSSSCGFSYKTINSDFWRITTPDGIIYEFRNEHKELTYSNGPANTYISAWHLSSIIDPNDTDQIDFIYSPTITNTENNNNYYLHTLEIQQYTPVNTDECPPEDTPMTTSYDDLNTFHTRYLQSITYKDQRIYIYTDASNTAREDYASNFTPKLRKTTGIAAYDVSSSRLLNSAFFHYSYFGSGNAKRLRLDSLFVGASVSNIPPYRFYYNNSTTLPEYESTGQDHWGYYNQKESNPSLIPPPDPEYYLSGLYINNPIATADREPTNSGSTAYMLEEIQYPTGGSAKYTYEVHENNFYEANCKVPKGVAAVAYGDDTEHGSTGFFENTVEDWIEQGDSFTGDVNIRVDTFIINQLQYVQFNGRIDDMSDPDPDPYSQTEYPYPTGIYLVDLSDTDPWDSKLDLESIPSPYQLDVGTYYLVAVVEDNPSMQDIKAWVQLYYYSKTFGCENTTNIGGARLKRTVLHDGISRQNDIVEDYFYFKDIVANFHFLDSVPVPFLESSTVVFDSPKYYEKKRCGRLYGSAHSSNPYQKNPGHHVGYSEVGIVRSGKENGLSVYKYNISPNPNARGTLKKEQHYELDGSFFKKVKEVSYEHDYVYSDFVTGKRFDVVSVELDTCYQSSGCPVDVLCYFCLYHNVWGSDEVDYKYASYGFVPTSKTETFYSSLDSISTTTDYYYEFKNNATLLAQGIKPTFPTKEIISSSNNDKKYYKRYFYPYSYEQSNAQIDSLKSQHIVSKLLAEKRGIVEQGNHYKTFEQVIIPKFLSDSSKVVDGIVYNFKTNTPESDADEYLKNEFISNFTKYDRVADFEYDGTNNSPVYMKRRDGIETVIVWGYDYTYPVAVVKNATFAEVESALNVSIESIQSMKGDSLISELEVLYDELPDSEVTLYSHIPFVGVEKIIDVNGNPTSYFYDASNRLILIKDLYGNPIKFIDYKYNQTFTNSTCIEP